jgi:hypothetical protein
MRVLRELVCLLLLVCFATSAVSAPKSGRGGGGNGDGPSVILSFASSSERVVTGESVILSWASESARSCTASGSWDRRKPLEGTFRTPALTSNATFDLRCKTKSAAM